jgi:hypothetical protein
MISEPVLDAPTGRCCAGAAREPGGLVTTIDADELETLLARTGTTAGGPSHGVVDHADAVFTWDYRKGRRPALEKLYEKAKTSQWNSETDLDWSTAVDPEKVAHEIATSDPRARHVAENAADSPLAKWGDADWTRYYVETLTWRLSQFLHGEQGALVCTAKIVETVPWIDAKYYAATQVMDEAARQPLSSPTTPIGRSSRSTGSCTTARGVRAISRTC